MAFLEIQDLKKIYATPDGKAVTVFEGVNFAIERGEFVCIIGHSGCGKTTILNVLAGLDTASDGVVVMDNREVAGPPLARGAGFPGPSLVPGLSVVKNIAFPAQSQRAQRKGIPGPTHFQKILGILG